MFQVVIDTNVLLSALRSKRGASYRLLTLIGDGRRQMNISASLIFEYEDVLKRDCVNLGLSPQDIDDILDYICTESNRRSIFYLWRPYLHDPKDDFILELAIESQCDFIITYNVKDFVGAEKFGIAVITPKELLQKLGEIS